LFKKEEFNNKSVSEIFLIEDKQIKKLIDKNSPEFNPRTEQEYQVICDFDDVFRLFIAFLQRFDENHFLNPTQIFALFYVLCDESKDTDIILSHIHNLSIAGKSKSKKNLWESHDEIQPRRDYFNRCLKFISSINERAPDIDNTPVSNQLKKQVWAKCVNGKCHICEDEINEKDFEAGHIEARALGGPTIIENLIPMCFACNRGMGTRNAYEFKKDMYPEYELVSQEIKI
jgi:5-methylcytosine-specific restriction endonuclease McrA